MKRNPSRAALVCILLLFGSFLIVYPFFASFLFEQRTDQVTAAYQAHTAACTPQEKSKQLAAARRYNEGLLSGSVTLTDPFSPDTDNTTDDEYLRLLCTDTSGVMGLLEVPCLGLTLPIYHTANPDVLEKGAGHLKGSSLPVGGAGTHCVLTGHTGLSTARMFTDLTSIVQGDLFYLRILDDVLTYKVDQIKVVDPSDISDLRIVPGRDDCTLLTCTPYGINSHRLLVRGFRVSQAVPEPELPVILHGAPADGVWFQEYRKDAVIAAAFLLATLAAWPLLRKTRRRKTHAAFQRQRPGRRLWHSLSGILLLILGLSVFFYPDIREKQLRRSAANAVSSWKSEHDAEAHGHTASKNGSTVGSNARSSNGDASRLGALRASMTAYNETLVTDGQILTDAWSYAQTPMDLAPLEENAPIGVISIPDMEVELPLYAGASEAHMATGAAVLSQTSLPIGGGSTNCVIAGHRGYSGAPYFRDIEKLTAGSLVLIENPWETLSYRVFETRIIPPDDVDSILIRENEDLVTLLTCHPYLSHGQQRYVVYCRRTTAFAAAAAEAAAEQSDAGQHTETSSPVLSKEQLTRKNRHDPAAASGSVSARAILAERLLRTALPFLLAALSAVILLIKLCKKKKEKTNGQK